MLCLWAVSGEKDVASLNYGLQFRLIQNIVEKLLSMWPACTFGQ